MERVKKILSLQLNFRRPPKWRKFTITRKATTNMFSQEARDSVSKVSSKKVLIDGSALTRYMIGHDVGVSARKAYEVKRLDVDFI